MSDELKAYYGIPSLLDGHGEDSSISPSSGGPRIGTMIGETGVLLAGMVAAGSFIGANLGTCPTHPSSAAAGVCSAQTMIPLFEIFMAVGLLLFLVFRIVSAVDGRTPEDSVVATHEATRTMTGQAPRVRIAERVKPDPIRAAVEREVSETYGPALSPEEIHKVATGEMAPPDFTPEITRLFGGYHPRNNPER